MLNLLRQGGIIKGIMGGVVLLIIAAFAMDYRGNGVPLSGKQCVVEVEGSCVAPKDYQMLIRLVAPNGATEKELRKSGFNARVVDALIERELLLREARRLGISVSEEQLDDELALGRVHYSWPVEAPTPAAVVQGFPYPITGASELVTYIRVRNSKTDAFDYKIYQRQIQNLLRMSPREFKERQEDELIAARVRSLVTSAVRVPEEEAFEMFERDRSQATARTVNVRTSWFERFAVDGSDEAAKAYAKAHAEEIDEAWEGAKESWKADCPLVAELLLSFTPGAEADERADREAQADRYKKLLKDGAPFARLARAFGDSESARHGGVLGCLDAEKYGAGGKELLDALSKVKPGDTTGVVETPRGFHILRLLGKGTAEEAERLGRLELARRAAITMAASEAAKTFSQQLIAAVKGGAELASSVEQTVASSVRVEGLDEAVATALTEKAKLAADVPEFEVSRPFSRSSSPMPGLKASDVAARVFDLPEVDNLIEEPLETYSGFAVIQLKEKNLASREDFEADKAQLMEGLRAQKRAEALTRYIARLKDRAAQIVINPAYDPSTPLAEEPSDPDSKNSG